MHRNINFLSPWIISIIYIFVGIKILSLGINIIMINQDFYDNSIQCSATIDEISEEKDVYVAYTIDGVDYIESISYYSYTMREGDSITIYYNPASPSNLRAFIPLSVLLIIPIFGFVLFFIGLIYILLKIIKAISNILLVRTGKLIYAELLSYHESDMIYYHARNYYITCLWEDPITSELHQFRSGKIWENPYKIIQRKEIKVLPVYINENNIEKYYISLKGLYKK